MTHRSGTDALEYWACAPFPGYGLTLELCATEAAVSLPGSSGLVVLRPLPGRQTLELVLAHYRAHDYSSPKQFARRGRNSGPNV